MRDWKWARLGDLGSAVEEEIRMRGQCHDYNGLDIEAHDGFMETIVVLSYQTLCREFILNFRYN